MKRIIALILLASFLFTLTSCGEEKNTPVVDEDLIVVGFSQVGAESEWRVANTENMKSVLCEENGFELIYSDAQQNQENQIRAIRNFIQQDVDYIVLAPVTESGWDSALQEAQDAGIPVIIVDRMVTVDDMGLYTAYIGSDFRKEGDKAMTWLEDYLSNRGRLYDNIRIVHIQGTLGSSPQYGRTDALTAAVERNTSWEIIEQHEGDFTRSKAYEVMRDILTRTTDIDVVYCENDGEALGVIDALEEKNIPIGPSKNGVIIISFDATNMGLTMCLQGKISCVVECNALQASYVADIIRRLEQKLLVEKIKFVEEAQFDCFTITQEMIDERTY